MRHFATIFAIAATIAATPTLAVEKEKDNHPAGGTRILAANPELQNFDIQKDLPPEEVTRNLNNESYRRIISVDPAANAGAQPTAQEPIRIHTGHVETEWERDTRTVRKLQKINLGLNLADVVLTYNCLQRGNCEEANPIYGRHPSLPRIIITKSFFTAAQWAITDVLLEMDPKKAKFLTYASIAINAGVVGWNMQYQF